MKYCATEICKNVVNGFLDSRLRDRDHHNDYSERRYFGLVTTLLLEDVSVREANSIVV